MSKSPMLLPVITLIAWSMVMLIWMFVTRVPAIIKSKMRLNRFSPRGEQMNSLPPEVRWKADNYNHLMEQPTLFYGIALVLVFLGVGDGLNLILAWAYVGLRIIHSLIQATVNIVMYRFVVFLLSSIVLMVMTGNALIEYLS